MSTVFFNTLVQENNWTPEKAVDHIRNCRPHILLHSKQNNAIRQYYETMHSKS